MCEVNGRAVSRNQLVVAALVFMVFIMNHSLSSAIQPLAKEWTFMVYSCADCDLEGFQLGYLVNMAAVGSTAEVNIVVQMDRIDGFVSSYGDWTDCKRFYVTQGLTPASENAIDSLGEVNMGDPNTLLDFLNWAVQDYPANRYFAMIIGHGWLDGVCPDSTSHDILTPLEIQWALNQVKSGLGVEVDVIGFEACQHSALEILYELGDSPEVVIASEELSTHWPYRSILSDMVASPTMDTDVLASLIVDHYSEFSWMGGPIMTLAAFNRSRIPEVVQATSTLASILRANLTTFGHAVLSAASAAEHYSPIPYPEDYSYYTSCRDLYDFAIEIKKVISDSSVQLAADNLVHAIENACIAEWHGTAHPNFHGLYIYLPADEDVYNDRLSVYGQPYSFAHPSWTQNTSWDDLLFQLFKGLAGGLRSREYIDGYRCTTFDSDNDTYLDALHIELDISTDGESIDVVLEGCLITPLGEPVDQVSETQTIDGGSTTSDLVLHTASEGEEGWYDVRVILYDEYGIVEDEIYLNQIAFLPEEMQHEVSVHDVMPLKTVVGQGSLAEIDVMIENEGHFQEYLNITTYANGTLIDMTQLTIPTQENVSFTIHWNTTDQSKGNYTLVSIIEPVEGEANITNNLRLCAMEICITLSGDFDADHDVDIFDIVRIAGIYGTGEEQQQYERNCDINSDGKVDIFDVVIVAGNYGSSW
ncbi:MAG: hypothetical protein AM326_05375 [Candidatus Thorarchaeota archaeon SMTZ-45]|nr:MAG: hypothetical protein AM326_05375 [Candidatus Thorarchaeota archaeon SMTZ-45]